MLELQSTFFCERKMADLPTRWMYTCGKRFTYLFARAVCIGLGAYWENPRLFNYERKTTSCKTCFIHGIKHN